MAAMREVYDAAFAQAEEERADGDRPAEVTAVARAAGMDPDRLWGEVEGGRGWEPHDQGYPGMVWLIAWELAGWPDWQGITPTPRTPVEAADDRWRAAHGD